MTTQTAAGRGARKSALIDIAAILLALMAAFLLRLPAAELDAVPADIRAEYVAEDGLPYFSELDSYYYLRKAKELAQGEPSTPRQAAGDEGGALRSVAGNVGTDKLGLSALAAAAYRTLSGVCAVTVEQVAFWLGALLSLLIVIPVYIYVRRQTNALGGFVGAVAAAVCVPYIQHTHPGFFDTDSLLGVLPLAFILSSALSMQAGTPLKRALWAAAGALALGLISQCWGGSAAYFYFLVLLAVIYALCVLLCPSRMFAEAEQARPRLARMLRHGGVRAAALCAALSLASLALFCGTDVLKELRSPFSAYSTILNSAYADYPSVGTYVSELKKLPLLDGGLGGLISVNSNGVINAAGGAAVLIAAACMLIIVFLCLRRLWQARSPAADGRACPLGSPRRLSVNGVLFAVWLPVGFALAILGARFTVFAAFPTAVLMGMAAGWLSSRLFKGDGGLWYRISLWLLAALLAWAALYNTNKAAAYIAGGGMLAVGAACLLLGRARRFSARALALCLALSMLLAPCLGAYRIMRPVVPDVSDTMADAMSWARNDTEPDATIASWWDYGYYIEYAAERRTLLDGGRSNAKFYCYIAGALLTDDAELSSAILRMLHVSSVDAVDALDALYGDAALTWEILRAILKLPHDEARAVLTEQYGVPPDAAGQIVRQALPADAPPLYLALSSDMQDKIQAISYYGSWTFEQSTYETRLFARSAASVAIEPGSSKALPLYGVKDMTATVGVGANGQAQAMLSDNSTVPATAVAIGELWLTQVGRTDRTILRERSEAPVLLLFGEGGRYSAAVMDKALARSMFTRLYLLGGESQDEFLPAYEGYSACTAGETAAQRRLNSLSFGSSLSPAYAALFKVLP